jgi:type 1 glutamine amidotransferase
MLMRRRAAFATIILVGMVLTVDRAQPALPRVLMVTHSAGFEHDVVRRPGGGGLSLAERAVADLARRSGRFDVTYVNTREEITAMSLATVGAHQAMLFFTTGELPMAPSVRQAIFRRVNDGAGFIGVHSATDTWYAVPEYRRLIGGVFDGHPWHRPVTVIVEDRRHPATQHLGAAFEIADEIYQFRDWTREHVHVLLRLDPRSIDVSRGARRDGDYALAWVRRQGKGRVFYTALGHEPAVWADERFRAHVLGAIEWALSVPEADRRHAP